jgi:hypothetical protein
MKQLHATKQRKTTQKHHYIQELIFCASFKKCKLASESMFTLSTNTKNLTCNKSGYSGENEYMQVLH